MALNAIYVWYPSIKSLDPGRGRKCQVLYSYHPSHDDELTLLVGDEIQLLGEVEEGWWRGRLGGKVSYLSQDFIFSSCEYSYVV